MDVALSRIDGQAGERQTERHRLRFEPAAAAPAQLPHVFADLPEHRMQVPMQVGGVDCGLYMLKYIELIAKKQLDLTGRISGRKRSRVFDSTTHPELAFVHRDIKRFRRDMHDSIEREGQTQKEKLRMENVQKDKGSKSSEAGAGGAGVVVRRSFAAKAAAL